MIKFKKVPQAGLPRLRLEYLWLPGRILAAHLFEVERDDTGAVTQETEIASEEFSLSELAPEELAEIEVTVLPANPIVIAETDESGDLHVTVVDWYDPEYEQPPTAVEEVIDE